MGELSPPIFEKIAHGYALQIVAGEITIDDIPVRPASLKPRVEELITQ